ncbi:hypothetical protein MCOR31_007510 [Pyricularia oryzae]|nr:hypothetical protein MCOR31_007510 [Pyricularia oryzae]
MKNAAESSWSFMHFSNQSFLLEYINAPLGSSIAHQVVRGELNKNLGTVTAPMAALIRQSFADSMPKCNGA